jgi:serine/threonine protein kinase
MKKGDNINGYIVLGEPKVSGLCTWSFASKGGKEYHIKEFLSPVYPDKSAPGSTRVKEKKMSDCFLFESSQIELINTIKPSVSAGGNLIFTIDFFRFGNKYYKITDKVEVATLNFTDISKLPFEKRMLILKTTSFSLGTLHNLKIVHGDLKPDNILIKRTSTGDYTSKLIDFDNCYFSGRPPIDIESVVGDPTYYSPELEKYIKEDNFVKPLDLTLKSDIFALGIIFCQYLTGSLPLHIPEGKTASNVVNNGNIIKIKEVKDLPAALVALINSMMVSQYLDRPKVSDIFNKLKLIDKPGISDEPFEEPISEKSPKLIVNTTKKTTNNLKINIKK